MYTDTMENKLDLDYKDLLEDVLKNGIEKEDRTGTGTLSLFGKSIRHDMSDGFPVLTTKRMPLKTISTELKWFLKGDTNIKYLLDNNCHIWDGDAYKKYCDVCLFDLDDPMHKNDFLDKVQNDPAYMHWGLLGPIYGAQWRSWGGKKYIDQIADLIENLKNNPNSRRHLVSAWNVEDLGKMTLPPCHYSFQCYVADNKLSLMWNQRSADLFLGVPFNISSYGLLLLLLCEETGYEAGDLIGNFGDIHLYKNHLEQAKEQINRETFDLPTIKLSNFDVLNGEFDFELIGYKSHSTIKAPLSN
jgi:thymidylate synthase